MWMLFLHVQYYMQEEITIAFIIAFPVISDLQRGWSSSLSLVLVLVEGKPGFFPLYCCLTLAQDGGLDQSEGLMQPVGFLSRAVFMN